MKKSRLGVLSVFLVVAAVGCVSAATAIPPTIAPSPTAVPLPTPTSLPGVEVVPLASLGPNVPWLPLDASAPPGTYFFLFNLSRQPFSNLLVRRAFAAAIDRGPLVAIAQDLGAPNAKPATTVTPSETIGRDLYNAVGIPFNPALARQTLDDAGYADRGTFPAITVLTAPNRDGDATLHQAIAERMAEMWRFYLGADVMVEVVQTPYLDRLTNDPGEIYRWGWGADYNDPDDFLNLVFHSGSEHNISHFMLAEFDELVDRAAASQDPAERQLLYIEAERILCEEFVAVIPIFHAH